ncbi:MAG: hypothetical protein ABIS20_19565 [Thermoanaerobaculia bacterium]
MTRGSSPLRSTALLCLPLLLGLALPARAASPWRPQGEEFAVNTRTFGSQYRPAVASDSAGNTFVAWIDNRHIGLKGRAYNASGTPVSGEIAIEGFSGINLNGRPRVAALGPGDFIVTWGGPNGRGIKFRRFNALGQPLSDTLTAYDEPIDSAFSPDVAADPAGGFILCWSVQTSAFRVLIQRFDSFGAPRAGALVVSPESGGRKDDPRVAVDPVSGRFMVTWIDQRETENPDVWARRLNASGQPLGPEFLVDTDKGGEALGAMPVFHNDGFSVVWSNFNVSRLEILAQRFDAAGSRAGGAVLLSLEQGFYAPSAPAVAVAPSGGLLVLWAGVDQLGPDAGVRGRLFDGEWRPAGALFEVNTYTQWSQTEPSVAVDGRGNFTAVWSSGEDQFVPTTPPGGEYQGQDGSSFGVYGQRFSLAGCVADGDTLCLNGGRFAVRATWKNPFSGETGVAHSHPLAADTGALWFFDPANLELMIKVLDARAVNGHFWVFYGALSNVEYTVTVADTQTGAVRTYHNPAFQLSSRADVSAFAEAAPAGLTASSAAVTAAAPPPISPLTPKAGSCAPTATALCLAAGRFAVEVVWTDPRIGLAAQARALPITADTGVFWFVDATNLELMIKVLDGRGVNGHFWVFYGALSDLEYTITVTDTETGERRTYHNPRNNLASLSDVTAF